MLRPLLASVVVSSVLLAAMPSHAQTGDGSLRGYVKDEQGGVLPGVTVTATSPVLLAPVVAVSENDGLYRLINLPPGIYTITAELTGFATYRREGILMRAGITFNVGIDMTLGSVSETVTVSGDSPMVEISSPSSVLNIQGDLVRAAPITSRRLFSDVLEMAPGVTTRNVTNGYPGRATYFHGAHLYAHAFQLEGAPAGSYFDASAFAINIGGDMMQDMELKMGGVDAASPTSTGVVMNVVTPLGGNRFKGSAAYTYQPLAWNSDNTQGGRVPGGLPTLQETKQWDLSLGGPVVRDRVWFFGSYRRSDLINGISRTGTDLGFLRAFKPDFQPFNNTYWSNQPFVKVTAKLSVKHELAAFYQYDRNWITLGAERETESINRLTLGGGLTQTKVSSVWTNRLMSVFAVAYNTKSGTNKQTYNLPYGVGPQVLVHQNTFLSSGVPTGTGRLVQMNNLQSVAYLPAFMLIVRGDVTYYRQGWGGSHEFKTGIWAAPKLNRDIVTRYLNDGFVLEEVRQIDSNNAAAGTVPFHRRYRTPTEVTTTLARDRDVGIYVQDAWKPHPRVTANMGVRVDFVRRHDAIFDIDRMKSVGVGPRLGVAYQVTKDARTVLRASYGRVFEQVNGRDFITEFASGLPRGATIRDLYDANGDGVFETDILTPAATTALSGSEFDPNMHQPFVDDFIVGLRRQFPGQISVDVSATRRYYQDGYALVDINGFYPDGPSLPFGGFGKVDPNRGIIYQQTNNSWNTAVHTALEAVVAKNLSHNFQLLVSLNRQWAHESGFFNPTDPARFIQPDAFPNNRMLMLGFGNADQNNLDGRGQTSVNAYRPYAATVAGQYFAPWGIMLAGSYAMQAGDYSGQIVTRIAAPDPRFGPPTVRLADGTTQPNPLATTIRFAFPTRGEGQVRNETARYLQLTVGRVFKVKDQGFEAQLNMFNVFNAGPNTLYTTGSNQLYSANYLAPGNRHPPRVFAVTVKYRF
jgi:carboxypeptidase family protein